MTKKLLYSALVLMISLVVAISAFAQTPHQEGSTNNVSTRESYVIGSNGSSDDVAPNGSLDDPATSDSSDDPLGDSSASEPFGNSSGDPSGGSSDDPASDPSTAPPSWDSVFASVPLDPGICGPVLNPAVREDFRRISPILVDRCEIISPSTLPSGQGTDPIDRSGEAPSNPTEAPPVLNGVPPNGPSTVPADQDTPLRGPGTSPYEQSTTPTP